MKKVLLINDLLVGGGSETVVRLEKDLLLKNGYDVYVISFGENDMPSNKNYVLSPSRFSGKLNKFILSSKMKNTITEIIDEIEPDLIHLHLISKYPLAIYNSNGLNDVKIIQTLHGPNLFCSSGWGGLKNSAPCDLGIGTKCYSRGCISLPKTMLYMHLKERYWKSLNQKIDLFHCPSLNMLNTAKRFGFENSKFFPLSIGDDFRLKPQKQQQKRPTLLFMGAIAEQKGVRFLLPALLKIKKQFPDVLLRVAGSGNLLEKLKTESINLKLEDNVEFLGFINHKEVRSFYLSGSVLLMPSIWHEQFGLVGPEAMACEVPVVGSNIGGIPEWLRHNENGLLVPPQDVNELALAVIKLLKDDSLRKEMGFNGRKYVLKEFGGEKFSNELLKMIKSII